MLTPRPTLSTLFRLALVGHSALWSAGCATVSWSAPTTVLVNQVGYSPTGPKLAVVQSAQPDPVDWKITDTTSGATVAQGKTSVFGVDAASGDSVHRVDFSSLTMAGTYRIAVAGHGQSVRFSIAPKPLGRLPEDAMAYFYFHRMGTAIAGEFLHNRRHARAAVHAGDERIPSKNGWTPHVFQVRYSWADAGDFGLYPVNHAFAVWTLANLFERYEAFGDGALSIPERNNGIPDIVDELLYGSTYLKGMLPPSGLASHKIHNDKWSPFPVSVAVENTLARSALPPSTNATWAVARVYAHLARLIARYDADRADAFTAIAEDAYRRADQERDVDYSGKDKGGGSYPDATNEDDRYAAAVELYLSTRKAGYRRAVTDSRHYGEVGPFDWSTVATTGTLSLLSVDNDLPIDDLARMKAAVIARASTILRQLDANGYPSTLRADSYVWGSNAAHLTNIMVIAYAYDLNRNTRFLHGALRALDYLFGVNAMRLSYVTGYGTFAERDLHDRLAYGAYAQGVPFPPGWIAGGPNNIELNDGRTPRRATAAKSYAGANTAAKAWCSKENAINWNAPLAWVAWYLRAAEPDLAKRRRAEKTQSQLRDAQ